MTTAPHPLQASSGTTQLATQYGGQVLPPTSWLGMVGGGQLGRMFCHAAQRLGYRVAVLEPDPTSPAGAVADLHIQTAYDAPDGLATLLQHTAAISTEFENVPAHTLQHLAAHVPVSPSAAALAVTQDRIHEKAFAHSAGAKVVSHAPVENAQDIHTAADNLFPGLLKTARLGYDGKGQHRVATRAEALHAWHSMGEPACVLETLVPLALELSVVVVRDFHGQVAVYDPVINEHRDGILAVSTVAPDVLPAPLVNQARQTAITLARALDYRGVLCVEFFVLHDGRLLVNEMAPRPHNSGHHSIDTCPSSQFDQQARVLAGLPLGDTTLLCPAVMLNLLGDLWFDARHALHEPDWAAVLAVPQAHLHLYGKTQARLGRKMGHITITGATLAQASARAAQVAAVLGIPYCPVTIPPTQA